MFIARPRSRRESVAFHVFMSLTGLLAVVCLVLLVTSCSAPAPAQTMPAPPPLTAPVTPAPAPQTADPAPSPSPKAAPAVQPFKAYAAEVFQGASWLQFIDSGEAKVGGLWITTSLYNDADATEPAIRICSAGRAYVMDHPDLFPADTVRVADQTGMKLAEC